LNAFKSEDSTIRVILLSLENAASGTNLMEASQIILLGIFFHLFYFFVIYFILFYILFILNKILLLEQEKKHKR